MGSVSDNLVIVNQALNLVGEESLTVYPDATTKPGRIVTGPTYVQTVREVLRMLPWPCAVVRASVPVAANASMPEGGYTFKSTLPADCIRVLDINGDKANISRLEARTLYHISSAAIILRYISFITVAGEPPLQPDPTTWDALLEMAIIARLASKVAHVLTGQYTLAQSYYQEYFVALAAAKSVIAVEANEDLPDIMGFWADLSFVMTKTRNEASE
jgi:hypothetical protein